jgi:phytoene dehydrogenase-like protein
MLGVWADTRRFGEDGEMRIRPSFAEIPLRYPRMVDAMSSSWQSYMERHLSDPEAMAVFSTLWGYYGLPPSRLNAATFILPWVSYHYFGAWYPKGRSAAVSGALEEFLVSRGGRVHYGQTVDRIEIEDGRAVAVGTERGLRIEADAVISNANPRDTVRFAGLDSFDEEYHKQVTDPPISASNLVLYLGLGCSPAELEWPRHEHFVVDSYDIDADFDAAMAGRFDDAGMVISHYSHADAGAAPEGSSVLVAMTLASWESS